MPDQYSDLDAVMEEFDLESTDRKEEEATDVGWNVWRSMDIVVNL